MGLLLCRQIKMHGLMNLFAPVSNKLVSSYFGD